MLILKDTENHDGRSSLCIDDLYILDLPVAGTTNTGFQTFNMFLDWNRITCEIDDSDNIVGDSGFSHKYDIESSLSKMDTRRTFKITSAVVGSSASTEKFIDISAEEYIRGEKHINGTNITCQKFIYFPASIKEIHDAVKDVVANCIENSDPMNARHNYSFTEVKPNGEEIIHHRNNGSEHWSMFESEVCNIMTNIYAKLLYLESYIKFCDISSASMWSICTRYAYIESEKDMIALLGSYAKEPFGYVYMMCSGTTKLIHKCGSIKQANDVLNRFIYGCKSIGCQIQKDSDMGYTIFGLPGIEKVYVTNKEE